MEDLWKRAFPVGTEWSQYSALYNTSWDFSHLEDAFNKGGFLWDKVVWLFGCTEPQMIPVEEGGQLSMRAVHVPAITAVVCDSCPSEQLGVKSVQMVEETIIPMRDMHMSWVPVISSDMAAERQKAKIHVMTCTQRRSALKRLTEERVKKYEYCLPYLFNPLKEGEVQYDSIVQIMYTFGNAAGGDPTKPPIVTEFDWKFDEEEDFLQRMEEEEGLPREEREKFWAFCQEQAKEAKTKIAGEKRRRKEQVESIPAHVLESLRNLKVYKFYPQSSHDTPNVHEYQSSFVNRYYGKADEVFPPLKQKATGIVWGSTAPVLPPVPNHGPEGNSVPKSDEAMIVDEAKAAVSDEAEKPKAKSKSHKRKTAASKEVGAPKGAAAAKPAKRTQKKRRT